MAGIEDDIDDIGLGEFDVSLEDDIDSDDDDGGSRKGRRAQRGNRMREAETANKKYEEENDRLRGDLSKMRSEFDHFRGEANSFARGIEERGEDKESDLERLSRAEQDLQKEWQVIGSTEQGKDPEVQQRYLQRHQDIKDERQRAIVQDEMSRNQQPRQSSQAVAVQTIAQTEFSDVAGNQKALAWANGYHQQQLAMGRDNDVSLARESFEAARDKLGTSGRSSGAGKPSASDKGRYAGVPSGNSGGGGESPKSFRMTPEFRKMADAAFPDLAPAKRYQTWARNYLAKD